MPAKYLDLALDLEGLRGEFWTEEELEDFEFKVNILDHIINEEELMTNKDILNFTMPEAPKGEDVEKLCHLARAVGINPDGLNNYILSASKAYEQAKLIQKELEEMKKVGIVQRISNDNKDVVKHSWHERLATDVQLGRTVAVRGPAGNGKSTGVSHVLKELGYNIYHMDCTDSTTAEQLVGGLQPVVKGGGLEMEYAPGVMTKAFLDPKGAIQLDEFDAIDPRIAMSLQSALHRANGKKRWLSSPDHKDGGVAAVGLCPIVVTMNTWGSGANREYVGRNILDGASMDRFNTVLDTSYEFEESVLGLHGIDKTVAKKIVADAQKLRQIIDENAIRVILSTRRLMDIGESVSVLKCSLDGAWERDFMSRLSPETKKAISDQITKKNIKLGK